MELSGSVTVNASVAETCVLFARWEHLSALACRARELVLKFERSGDRETQLTLSIQRDGVSETDEALQERLDDFARMVDEIHPEWPDLSAGESFPIHGEERNTARGM